MKKEIRKLKDSFSFALRGLKLCVHGERNFRVHLTAAFYVTVFALLGQADAGQIAALCLCFGLTMSAELLNTAIERLCDKQASGYDMLVRDAKDIACLLYTSIDTFHMNIEEADMLESIALCAPEIQYVHFSDSNRMYPGGGHTDMAGVLRKLHDCGYRGVLSAEILPRPDKETAAREWIAAVRELIAEK